FRAGDDLNPWHRTVSNTSANNLARTGAYQPQPKSAFKAGRGGAAGGTSIRSCGLACEQFVLLGPVQRQIEFGQPRRGELDRLPALQDRLDQLRAQEGEANETANV